MRTIEEIRAVQAIRADEVAAKYSVGQHQRIIDKKCPRCNGPLYTVNALLMTIDEAKRWLECGLCGEWVLNVAGQKHEVTASQEAGSENPPVR